MRTLLVALLVAAGLIAAPASAAPAPTATGALFVLDHRLGPHYCSASVVHSRTHDLIVTAAHCVYLTGAGVEFVPGYDRGAAPSGGWRVTAAYVDAAWQRSHDPQHDVAILRVAAHDGTNVEDRTAAPTLGTAPKRGTRVAVAGYTVGSDDSALHCTTRSYLTTGYPSVDCVGFGDGTSGGPWRVGARLVGVTGGLHEGGCSPDTSYSAPFGAATGALLRRAERGGAGDIVLPAPDDGC